VQVDVQVTVVLTDVKHVVSHVVVVEAALISITASI